MSLTCNELININGGCFNVTNIIRTVRIYVKYFIVKYFI